MQMRADEEGVPVVDAAAQKEVHVELIRI